jgi:hypothetical protein
MNIEVPNPVDLDSIRSAIERLHILNQALCGGEPNIGKLRHDGCNQLDSVIAILMRAIGDERGNQTEPKDEGREEGLHQRVHSGVPSDRDLGEQGTSEGGAGVPEVRGGTSSL